MCLLYSKVDKRTKGVKWLPEIWKLAHERDWIRTHFFSCKTFFTVSCCHPEKKCWLTAKYNIVALVKSILIELFPFCLRFLSFWVSIQEMLVCPKPPQQIFSNFKLIYKQKQSQNILFTITTQTDCLDYWSTQARWWQDVSSLSLREINIEKELSQRIITMLSSIIEVTDPVLIALFSVFTRINLSESSALHDLSYFHISPISVVLCKQI